MIELKGKYNSAKVYTDNIEEKAVSQIIELCNQEFCKDNKIRIMPDVHAGAGCTIGTTMTIKDKVVPNLVGVDISCGMLTVSLGDIDMDFKKLDKFINENIPSGQNVNSEVARNLSSIWEKKLSKLHCSKHINHDRAIKSIGTLGGGNHFIEISKGYDDNKYLVIHSGSRYLGKQVAEYYQDLAYKNLTDNRVKKQELVQRLKLENKEKDIQVELKKLPTTKINKDLAYLEGEHFKKYIDDMRIIQEYSSDNRFEMAKRIVEFLGLTNCKYFETIHNYIDIDNMILRKGAISAQKDEVVLIPINMRDGSIIAKGKGNPDWNYSAPHGAGRIMSRRKAKENVTIDEFEESMKGIWTSSVCESTIDESPMTYKPIQEILTNIKDTVEVIDIIKPIYNFKAH